MWILLVNAFTTFELEYQNATLRRHNSLRAQHCAPPLQLDAQLNTIAQDYADYLARTNRFQHSNNGYGENLYMASSSRPITTVDGNQRNSFSPFKCCLSFSQEEKQPKIGMMKSNIIALVDLVFRHKRAISHKSFGKNQLVSVWASVSAVMIAKSMSLPITHHPAIFKVNLAKMFSPRTANNEIDI